MTGNDICVAYTERYRFNTLSYSWISPNIGLRMNALRRRTDSILVREVGQELLLLDTELDQIHQLNPTAKFIWQRCEGKSTEEIAQLLMVDFDVDFKVARQDVARTLGTLRNLKLIDDVAVDPGNSSTDVTEAD